jgi:hypothetical protein
LSSLHIPTKFICDVESLRDGATVGKELQVWLIPFIILEREPGNELVSEPASERSTLTVLEELDVIEHDP